MNRIPKELHLYWDRSKMSRLQSITTESFHKLNPDWKINVYVPKQEYTGNAKYIPDYLGEDYFHLVEDADYVNVQEIDLDDYGISHDLHNILRSDIFRYYILYDIGGVWSDFDIVWLKPMEHFKNIEYYGDTPIEEVNTIVSFIYGTYGGHSIGILIHCKNDPYMASMIEHSKNVKPPFSHEIFGGSLMNTHYPTLESYSDFGNVIGAKFETYYPYNIHPPSPTIDKLYMDDDTACINNNVICLHWYNGHPFSKRHVNYSFGSPCSMTTILKEGGYI